jgi:phosphoglycerol transferase MdoB-like AlkP superfamily enzyme
MEYMNFGGELYRVMQFLDMHPLSARFSVIAISLLFAVLLLLCRFAFIAGGVLGFFSLLAAAINYMKVEANGDNFFPRDIAMLGNVGELLVFAGGSLPRWFWVGIAALVSWVLLLWFFRVEIPFRRRFCLPMALCIALAVFSLFSTPQRSEAILDRFGMSVFDAALQSSNYAANGFLGAFIINILTMQVERPADYSRESILALLEGFEATPARGEYFDVLVVLSESFFDVRILEGVHFSQNPLPRFDEVRERPGTVSGLVYTTALYGGTIRPEFDILTGLTTDHLPSGAIPYELLRRAMPTYVSNYRDAGYRTIALHPYDERFYARNTAYPLLGFDEFWGAEALMERFDMEFRRRFIADLSLVAPIKYFLNNADKPTFLFVITMQNHQPFPALAEEEIEIALTSDRLSPDVLESVTSFTQGLHEADKMLGMLVDYIDARERPTILLFFGDHLPNLGPGYGPFVQTGLVPADAAGRFTPEARRVLYATPFVIHANRDLDPGILERHSDNHISTYYLLAAVAVMTQFHRTPYMNLLLDHHARVPVHNVRLLLPETEDIRRLTRMLELMTYDRLLGNLYSESFS